MSWITARLKIIGAGLAAILIGIAVAFIRKSGGDAERAKQAGAELKAANTVAVERAKARSASDAAHQEGIKKWTKKP